MMSPLPSLSQIYSLLVQEEKQRQVRSGLQFQAEVTSFSATTGAGSGGNVAKSVAPRRTDGRRSSLFCEHNSRSGHIVDRCYEIHGYPNNNNRQGGRGKFTKVANNAWGECEGQSEGTVSPSTNLLTGLNQEQSKQLLAFLLNLTSSTEAKGGDAAISAAHMAGIRVSLNVYIIFVLLVKMHGL